MKKSKIIQKTVKLFLAFVMFLGVLFQNSSLTSAQGTEVDRVNTKITRFEIKNHDGTPAPGYHYWNQYRLDMDWDASSYGNQLKQGDYFIVKLPEQFKFPTDGPTVDFKLYAPDGKTVVANAHVNSNGEQGGGTVKVTFTKYVENRENVKGNLYLQAGFAHSKINVGGDNIIDIQIGSVKKSTNIKIGPKPTISDRLYVDEGNLPPTIHYIRDSFVLYELEYDQYGNTSRVINIYKYNDLKDFIKFSENDTQFTFEYSKKFGDINGRQYRLTYNTTYIPQLKLKNEGTFKSTEKNVVYRSWFKNAEAGGTGQGDLIQKIKIFKVDENDRQIKLPNAEFLITKVKDGSTFTLKTDAQGEAVSEKLEPGKYKIKETKAPDGYILDPTEKEVNVVEGEVLFWTATNAKITNIDIAGKKTWDDANNQDGKRPDKIKVILKKTVDGTTTTVAEKEVKADTDGNWKYEFNNLPKYENGKLITYSIDEEDVPGYKKSKDGYNLKNTRTPEKVSIAGVKSWDDGNNQDGKRPDKIKVILNKTVDGQTTKVTEKEVTKENNWSYEFNDLPKYENGKEITYSIDEEAVPGYEKSTDGYNLKNKYTPEKVSIAGKKIWDDKNNQDRKRPDKIKVILNKTVDGVKTKVTEKEVTVLTNWRYEFNNLPKYENGKEITYSIDEEAVPGYEKSVEGYNLKNTHTPEKVAISGKKIWDDNHNEHGKRPDKIKVILNKTVNGKTTKVAEKEVTAENNWNYAFTDLPKYENGKLIKYRIDEVDVPGYKKSIKGYDLTNKYIPPKPKLPNTGSTTNTLGGLGILGLLTGLVLNRRKNKTN
ncbi:Cna B-type domain-containing protein [Gemella morbillorum]|uniref:Cna B-type domain-containing protein n=1 Tax=Gemella morbillorum TaxID=29391 RepID=UPI0035693EB9